MRACSDRRICGVSTNEPSPSLDASSHLTASRLHRTLDVPHASRDTRLRARLTLRLRPLRISDRDRGLPRGRMSCGRIAYGLGMLDAAAPLVYGSPQAAMCGNWEVKRVGGRLTVCLMPWRWPRNRPVSNGRRSGTGVAWVDPSEIASRR
jgi:hypothetical protein